MQRHIRILSTVALLGILGSIVALAAGNIFNSWKGYSKGDEVVLEWKTSDESGIHSFEIERKSSESGYTRIGIVIARGSSHSYSYVDRSAFYKNQGGKQFTYRIKAMGTSTEEYSPGIVVTHEVASVRRSWGMIKELFR
jgi:hypothetical protein